MLSQSLTIKKNYQFFKHLFDQGKHYAEKGRFNDALAFYQMAAFLAWQSHCGIFVSPSLETACRELSFLLTYKEQQGHQETRVFSNVTHLMTQAYEIGGHTKLVTRWIQNDDKHKHNVLLLNQGTLPIPEQLKIAVSSSKGTINFIKQINGIIEKSQSILDSITKLDSDVVVLHIHPYDISVIPTLSKLENTPVIFLNHADHVFWVGGSVANVNACIRDSAIAISISRRHIPSNNNLVLPIPLTKAPLCKNRKELKESLGLVGKTVLLSIASSYKYKPSSDKDFCKSLLPIIDAKSDTVLIVIGPSLEDKYWKHYHNLSDGRIIPLGIKNDISDYYFVSDIYIDSIPFGSLTSVLDAGNRGIPTLFLSDPSTNLNFDYEYLKKHSALRADSINDLQKKLIFLIDNIEYRKTLGEKVKEEIVSHHCLPDWLNYLEDVYVSSFNNSKIKYSNETYNELTEQDYRLLETHSKPVEQSFIYAFFLSFPALTYSARLKAAIDFMPVFIKNPKTTIRSMVRLLPPTLKVLLKKTLKLLEN